MLFELQTKWNITLLQLPLLCELFPIVFLATQYLNTLLVLGFTVERYIAVCHPFQRDRYCTTRRAVVTIGGLTFLSLALNAVQGYFWKYYPAADVNNPDVNHPDNKSSGGLCRVRREMTEGGMASVWSIWAWVTELTVFGAVQLAIFALNLFVIAETRRLSASERERQLRPSVCRSARYETYIMQVLNGYRSSAAIFKTILMNEKWN
jgi:7 transmembrane receptor (rhodopsin family)